MDVTCVLEPGLTAEDFRSVLVASTLAARRPADDMARLDAMLRNASIIVTARDKAGRLVGVARAISDFSYCTYLSDLAVDAACQKQGIGKRLIDEVRKAGGPRCRLLLVAAPAAAGYYPAIGMEPVESCWGLARAE
jgi:ribosomal protein S18 acetylase RimI-like enzyme